MIAFNYPPLAGMGMLRNLKFAKYLPMFGWLPTVLTVKEPSDKPLAQAQYWYCDPSLGHLPNVTILRSHHFSQKSLIKSFLSFRVLCRLFYLSSDKSSKGQGLKPSVNAAYPEVKRRLMYFFNNWLEFPDNAIGWYPFALRDAKAYLKKNPVSLIYSSAAPMTSHLIAAKLSQKTGIPWIADFRDPWSQAHYRQTSAIRHCLDVWLEKRTIRNASALITVSEPLADDFLHLHRTFTNKTYVIYNGYDDDDYPGLQPSTNRPLTITFTGRMYEIDFISKGRTPELLFRCLTSLFQSGTLPRHGIQCLIYGEYPPQLPDMVSRYDLSEVVNLLGSVSVQEAARVQQEADVLLLLSWDDRDRKGILTGKIFEYLGARKNILSIPYQNEGVDRILRTTGAGVTITNEKDGCELLQSWYREIEMHGSLPYRGVLEEIAHYSRKEQTRKLASIFNDIMKRSRCNES